MWITALLLGITGSLHCAGMCSPLVMAVSRLSPAAITNRLLYNAGRITTYSILGLLASTFGSLLNPGPVQKYFSIALGVVFVGISLAGIRHLQIRVVAKAFATMAGVIKRHFARALSQKTWLTVPVLGMLNGLVPCGLTMMALGYCIILPGAPQGFLFMLVFGLGTLPVMLGLTTLISRMTSLPFFKAIPLARILLLSIGLFLILQSSPVHQPATDKYKKDEIVICR